jgi:preprotein translocase subunit SecE
MAKSGAGPEHKDMIFITVLLFVIFLIAIFGYLQQGI